MKKTFKIRRQKIHEAPTRIAELLQVYPALKSYNHVSICIIKMFSWYIYILLQLLAEFLRVVEKKHLTMQEFYYEPWDELQQEENLNVIRTLGLAEEDSSMSESKKNIHLASILLVHQKYIKL